MGIPKRPARSRSFLLDSDDFYYYMRIKYNRFRIYFEQEEFEAIFPKLMLSGITSEYIK